MELVQEVQSGIVKLIQGAIAGDMSSPFVEAASSEGKLTVGARDKDGVKKFFRVNVVEVQDVPAIPYATLQLQPQDGAGEAAQATEGRPPGTQTCGEAKEASPVQDDTSEETTDAAECNGEPDAPPRL